MVLYKVIGDSASEIQIKILMKMRHVMFRKHGETHRGGSVTFMILRLIICSALCLTEENTVWE